MGIARGALLLAALLVVGMVAWEASDVPRTVAGAARARPAPPFDGRSHLQRCAEDGRSDLGRFTAGPAIEGYAGFVLVARATDATVLCTWDESGVSMSESSVGYRNLGDRALAPVMCLNGWSHRGPQCAGYVRDDVAQVHVVTRAGKQFQAQVRAGMYLVDLAGTRDQEVDGLVHRAYDAQGRLLEEVV